MYALYYLITFCTAHKWYFKISNARRYTVLQSQMAVTAYMKTKQLLPFGFAWKYINDISEFSVNI